MSGKETRGDRRGHSADGRGAHGRGVDGRGVDGHGVDGHGVDGRGVDGRSPRAVLRHIGRGPVVVLGAISGLGALGLVLVAQGVAVGITAVVDGTDAWRGALWWGGVGIAVRALATWAISVASARTARHLKRDLRARLWHRMVDRPARRVGAATVLATSGLDDLDGYARVFLPALVTAVIVPVLVAARILAADPLSALIIAVTVPLVPLFMILIGMHTRDRVAGQLDALGRLSDHLVELARGLPVLVGLGRVEEQSGALADISDKHRRASMQTLRSAFASSFALELIATISVAVVAVFIGLRLVNGSMGLTTGLLVLVLAPECYLPLRRVGTAFHASQDGLEALERVEAVLAERVGSGPTRFVAPGVTVRDLAVRFPGRRDAVVVGLDFVAPAGEVTLLAGPSGCGKSTVLGVLAGTTAAEAVASGQVGRPVAVAYLAQHPRTVAATPLAELAAYGCAEMAEARALLARVGLGDAAATDAARLSPGELRRLAFARVLARVAGGAEVVLLDEPTAHLDRVNADLVRAEIAALRRRVTVVVASHDPGVHALVDHVVPIGFGTSTDLTGAASGFLGDADQSRSVDGRAAGLAADDCENAAGNHVPFDLAADATSPAVHVGTAGAETREPGRTPGERDAIGTRSSALGSQGVAGSDEPRDDRQTADIDATRPAQPLRELGRFLRPAGWRFAAAVGVAVLATGFAIALTVVSGWLIVRASQGVALMYLMVAIVGVRFFGVGRAALYYLDRLGTHDAVFRALTPLRLRLWSGLAARGPADPAMLVPGGTLGNLVADADLVRDLTPRVVTPPLVALVVWVGTSIALGILLPAAGVVVGAVGAVAFIVPPVVAVVGERHAGKRADMVRQQVLEGTADLFGAADDLRANGVTTGALNRLVRLDSERERVERRTAWATGLGDALVVVCWGAAAFILLAVAAAATSRGDLSAALVAVLVLTPLGLAETFTDLVAAALRWPTLAQVLGRVGRVTDATSVTPPGDAVLTQARRLELTRVRYRYPGTTRDVLDGIDAEAAPGRWLVVTGPSGSGKSTLLALLLRHLEPDAGRYEIDGRAADTFTPDSVRSRVAWCPQEAHLFDSTLRANLLLARTRDDAPGDAELRTVLGEVGLGPWLDELDDGLDTKIGSAGENLSGGQQARLAVARTLLTRAEVILLDEPTAHLDVPAARRLLADLRTALAERTTVLVTHAAIEEGPHDRRLDLGAAAPEGLTPRGVDQAMNVSATALLRVRA